VLIEILSLRKYNDYMRNNPSIYLNKLKVFSPVNHEKRDIVAVGNSCYLLYLYVQNITEVTASVAEQCNDDEVKLICSCVQLYSK